MREWCSLQAGKLDLTEVEGLADLLAAETEAQRIQVSSGHLLELLRHCAKTWKMMQMQWSSRPPRYAAWLALAPCADGNWQFGSGCFLFKSCLYGRRCGRVVAP